MKGFHGCGFEHAHDLMYSLVLCHLKVVDQPLLFMACVPYLDSVCEDRDDKGIVYPPPV